MSEQMIAMNEMADFFGILYPYIIDDEVTDIDYNGCEVWLTDSSNGRQVCEGIALDDGFVEQFTQRVANGVSKPFNKQNPILEAETGSLRITIVHESVALTGRCICIRKSLPYIRLSYQRMLAEGYCNEDVLELLLNCVANHMNIVVIGEPGAGKTELCKFLSGYIPDDERVITIEDTPEWHYRSLHPAHDCLELRINPQMDYSQAIRTCLRLNPKWIMLSETRSGEVVHLIESFSTGVRGITTLHASDVRKIPDRMLNMAGSERDAARFENDIYSFVDVGILVRRRQTEDAFGNRVVRRYIDQVCFFTRENGQNQVKIVVDGGDVVIPPSVGRRGTYYETRAAAVG